MHKKIDIYTDGSCLGNPGPGGWGALIFLNDQETALSGGEKDSTNNRMEMTAIIKALEWLHNESQLGDQLSATSIQIYSDSNLIIQTMNKGWKRKANTDLWAQMDKHRAWLDITWTWVKAHANNTNNNRVDQLAFKAAHRHK